MAIAEEVEKNWNGKALEGVINPDSILCISFIFMEWFEVSSLLFVYIFLFTNSEKDDCGSVKYSADRQRQHVTETTQQSFFKVSKR